jgi:Flp pilus assembly protein TadG
MFLRKIKQRPRHGTTLVECAIIYPTVFVLVLGMVVGGMAVYRYQEVAALARTAARYASTHGAQYRKDTNEGTGTAGTSAGTSNGILWYQASPTSAAGSDTSWTGDIYDNAIRPNLTAVNPQYLTVQVGWPPVVSPSLIVVQNTPDNWPGSRVTVTVTYQLFPEWFLVGPINLTSTATAPITN